MKKFKQYFIILLTLSLLIIIDLHANNINPSKYIDTTKCDQIIDKKIYSICYSYKYNGPLYTIYELDGNLVDKENIKKRPRFYKEKLLPIKYQVNQIVYNNKGYNRGHLTSDASFDYNLTDLQLVYSMANIVPQVPQVNAHKKLWAGLEIKERYLAIKYKETTKIIIINKVNYPLVPHSSQYLKGTNIVIPLSFEKQFIVDGIKSCYKIENRFYEVIPNNIEKFKIVCQD
jgi:endonuclease G